MPRKGHTGEQIAYAIREAQSGTPVAEITRKRGITEQTFYRWKKKYNGLDFTEVRKMKQLQDEN
ncbi:MAG: transposase, partial [Candidatus Lindowbacteria bacterium]|nr:transposase [Candidatus Lindowbacteria bacterium]